MPKIVYGNYQQRPDLAKVVTEDFEYKYPNGLDLKPGSDLHSKLLIMVLDKAASSASIQSSRFDTWQTMDHSLTGYIKTDDSEKEVKDFDERRPVSIVMPYSYAILETLLSYMMAAFFRDPIFRFEGVSPDDVMGSILLEQIVRLHTIKNKVMLNLHTMFRDAFVYGFGAVAPYWRETKSFAGNALMNIDPYRYLPDHNVAAHELQDGEYLGWTSDTNYMNLLTQEFDSSNEMFNVKYVNLLKLQGTSIYDSDNSGRYTKTGATKDNLADQNKPITLINMYVKLVPNDWGLSNEERPQTWLFKIAGDAIITEARPTSFDHEKYPVAVAVPDFDGYSSAPVGRLEILSGMQGVLDWLFNSHVANVRKAVNDTLVYDPSMINSKDLADGKPGGLIRMRRQFWGRGGVKDAIHQLQINDVTRGNVADSGWIINSMQTLMGTDEAAMGSLRQGGPERLTKAEFQGTAQGAVNRLERVARIVGLQAMQDIGEFFASHTQQLMTNEQYIKVTGTWTEILLEEYRDSISRGRMIVSPKDLDINYDVLVRDGSIPGGNFSDVWMRMFDTLGGNPELAQNFDMVKIFKYIARNSGAKNVNDFVRRTNVEVQPDAQVQAGAQAGNLIPIQGAA